MKCISIEERAINLAHYIIDSKDTVRGAAKKFGISKSTVHKDVSERLKKINPGLAKEVRVILDENKAERHMRGGMATKMKGITIDEKQLEVNKAIIQSMTKEERLNPDLIKASRRKRIADGSGTSIQQVNMLLRQFEQSKEMMKQLKGRRGMRGMF